MKDGDLHICVCVGEEGMWVAETGFTESFVTGNSGRDQLSFLRLGCKKTGFHLAHPLLPDCSDGSWMPCHELL